MRFARWVNAERCHIVIKNDADGYWTVALGVNCGEFRCKSLGTAMLQAFDIAENNPHWIWTSDYLKTI